MLLQQLFIMKELIHEINYKGMDMMEIRKNPFFMEKAAIILYEYYDFYWGVKAKDVST